ncbi:MAG: MBL fold metallo-hydrolase [Candidatus Sumerlaeia bacterium]|nr:MBL fold metallo-hydrolase [Candidatus Sumerlaeia bacterium]
MEILFLGTGAAWGVPEIGCKCPACCEARQNPKYQRTRTSILLKSQSTILIDPTPDLRGQLLKHKIYKIDAVIITHAHPDHFLGLDEFCARNEQGSSFKNIPLFVGKEAWEKRISKTFSYLIERKDAPLRIRRFLEPKQKFVFNEWQVTTFPTRHSNPEKIGATFGLIFKKENRKIVYTADYCELLYEHLHQLSNADLFITEATWLNEQERETECDAGHISFSRCWREYILHCQPKRIALVHISHKEGITIRQWRSRLRQITKSDNYQPQVLLPYDGYKMKI